MIIQKLKEHAVLLRINQDRMQQGVLTNQNDIHVEKTCSPSVYVRK